MQILTDNLEQISSLKETLHYCRFKKMILKKLKYVEMG